MTQEYDFVVFGASGFTGKYVCKELLKQYDMKEYKVAFAGRNRKKLRDVEIWIQQDSSIKNLNDGIIIADVQDEQSLINMCKTTKVLLDCVGPYKLWGESVVRACLETGCDYVDITGEPEYMERIEMKYQDIAAKKGVYIISACGFDSIPSELGMVYAKEKFNGTLATVVNYFKLHHGRMGMTGNYGTYASIVNGFAGASSLRALRRAKQPKPLQFPGARMKLKPIHYNSLEQAYALPFPGADVSIVKRSQRYFYEQFEETPAQFAMYFCCSFLQMVRILIFGLILKLFTSFSWGTHLLLEYPRFFTAGAFSKQGPTEEQMAGSSFQFTMYCKGYKQRSTALDIENANKPDADMVVKITGPEIGYVLTPIVMVQSALCLREERDNLPPKGGVFTAGPALKKTSILQRVQEHGLSFEVIHQS